MRKYFLRVPKWSQQLYPKAIWSAENYDSIDTDVLYTIDDGPNPESTPLWLDLLKEQNIKAIFFLVAQKCERYPELIDRIKQEGHVIGSHGYAHLDGWRTSNIEYIRDIKRSLDIINTKLFRPAYGRMTRSQYKSIKEFADIMMWSLMPGDFDSDTTAEVVSKRLALKKKGDIIVLHDDVGSYKKCAVAMSSDTNT